MFQIRRPNGSRDSREAEFWDLKATRSNECGHLHPRVLWWQIALRSMTDVAMVQYENMRPSWFAISWYILVLCGNIPLHPYSEILLAQVPVVDQSSQYIPVLVAQYSPHSFDLSINGLTVLDILVAVDCILSDCSRFLLVHTPFCWMFHQSWVNLHPC